MVIFDTNIVLRYLLNGVYKMERQLIAETIMAFLELVSCDKDNILRLSLHVYASNNFDFVDCVLYAYNRIDKYNIATFDKKLLRLLENVSNR